jgi:hypothetical protein
VVDNFNDMTGENGLGGSLWTSSGGGATIDTAYDPANRYGDSGAGYRVSFTGVTSSAWAATGTELMSLDASAARTISFCIKGANGGERPNIYLANRTGATETKRFVDIENYITVTRSWQRVDIPLEHFARQGIDLAHLAYFQVVFEWEEMAGTIYLDDIQIGSIFGDMDWDCDVDVADIQQVASRWRCKCGDACYNSLYDVDGDCDIDIVDIMKVAAHWGAICR